MTDQLGTSPEQNTEAGINAPQAAPLHPRTILGDNLPSAQAQKSQKPQTPKPIILPQETVVLENLTANDNAADNDIRTIQRIFLKLLFGGSSFSLQAAMLKKRRSRAKRKAHKSAEEIMRQRSYEVLGNPDQATQSIKKAA